MVISIRKYQYVVGVALTSKCPSRHEHPQDINTLNTPISSAHYNVNTQAPEYPNEAHSVKLKRKTKVKAEA